MIKNIDNTTREEREEVLDKFGKKVVEFRDRSLEVSMEWATGESINPVAKRKYGGLAELTKDQRELVNNLISETMTSTIFNFLNLFDDYSDKAEPNDWFKLTVKHKGEEYDLSKISWKMGSEIACEDEDGWIQKFSKVGRFVL